MVDLDWQSEPDLKQLRALYSLLSSDPEEALPELEALAKRGSLASAFYLADFYVNRGRGSHFDIEKAKYWYSKADAEGVPEASYMLGRLYSQSQEFEGAFSAFSKGASKGYPPAIYRLAKMYRRGEGVAQDASEYKRLLEIAKSKGHVFAKRDLAGLLLTGKFGISSMARGAIMLFSLWLDIARLICIALRRDSVFDERILA